MLGTIRDYALERLSESGEGYETRHLHALYYLSLAQEADPYLTGSQQLLWLERLEHDHDNFRAALSWAIEKGECELAAGMGGGAVALLVCSRTLQRRPHVAGAHPRFLHPRRRTSSPRTQNSNPKLKFRPNGRWLAGIQPG